MQHPDVGVKAAVDFSASRAAADSVHASPAHDVRQITRQTLKKQEKRCGSSANTADLLLIVS